MNYRQIQHGERFQNGNRKFLQYKRQKFEALIRQTTTARSRALINAVGWRDAMKILNKMHRFPLDYINAGQNR